MKNPTLKQLKSRPSLWTDSYNNVLFIVHPSGLVEHCMEHSFNSAWSENDGPSEQYATVFRDYDQWQQIKSFVGWV